MGLIFITSSAYGATSTNLNQSTKSWDGKELPTYTLIKPEVTIKEIIIAPGEKLPWHQHPVINAGILLSGELVVRTQDKKELNLKAGDTLIELVNTSHTGENIGTVPAKIVVFYFGEKDAKVTILDH